MTISVACDMCGKDYRVSDAMAGKNMPCKDCGAKIKIPGAPGKSRARDEDDGEEVINRPPPRSSATIRTHRSGGRTRSPGGGSVQFSPNLTKLGVGGGVVLAVLIVGAILSGGGGGGAPPPVAESVTVVPAIDGGNPLARNTINMGGGAPVPTVKKTTPAAAATPPTQTATTTPSNTASTASTKNLSVKPSVSETSAALAWSAQPDPIPADWTVTEVSPKFNLKILGESSDLKFADAHSPFILMNFKRSAKPGFEVWNLKDEKRVGGGPVPEDLGIKSAFSGDGQHLAFTLLKAANRVRIISTTDGKVVNEIEADISGATMQYLEFGPTGLLVTYTMGADPDGKRFARLRGIEFATGNLKWELSDTKDFSQNQPVFSPTRKYVMSITDHRVTGKLLDLETGKLAGEFTLPDVDDLGKPFNFEAAGFSPDGTKLAVLQTSMGSSGVSVIDVATGKIAAPIVVPGRLSDAFPDAMQYDGPKIDWLPDQSGWILGGLAMLDAATARILWRADLEHDPQYPPLHNSFWRKWIPGGLILVDGPRRAGRLKFTPMSWSDLRELAAQVSDSDEAIIAPGKSISLKVEVGELRGGSKESTEAALIQALTARLDRDGLLVEDEQPVMLRVKYREATGNTLQESTRPPGRPTGGTPTGKAVDATKALLEFAIIDPGGKTVYWADSMVVDPTFLMFKGDVNSANARQAMFDGLLNRLAGLPLPFYLTKNKKGPMLPAVYKIPYKE